MALTLHSLETTLQVTQETTTGQVVKLWSFDLVDNLRHKAI